MDNEATEQRPFVASKTDGTEPTILLAKHARDAANKVLNQHEDWDGVIVFDLQRGKRFQRATVAVPA